jgi:hypothetical protein
MSQAVRPALMERPAVENCSKGGGGMKGMREQSETAGGLQGGQRVRRCGCCKLQGQSLAGSVLGEQAG